MNFEPKQIQNILRRGVPGGGSLVPVDRVNDIAYLRVVASKVKKSLAFLPPASIMPRTSETFHLQGLEAMRDVFNQSHEQNEIQIELQSSPLGNRYQGSRMILGPVVRMARAEGSTLQFDFDGSHMNGMPGFIKAVVYTDANAHYFPVVIAHDIVEESGPTWGRFIETFLSAVPEANTPDAGLCSDRDGGLISSTAAMNSSFVHCVLHIENNILTQFAKRSMSVRREYIKAYKAAAWADNRLQFNRTMGFIQRTYLELFNYLHEIPYCTWALSHFAAGRHSQNTTNCVESFWSAISEARDARNIVQFYYCVYEWTMQRIKTVFAAASAHHKAITPHAQRHFESKMEKIRGNTIDVSVRNATEGVVKERVRNFETNREYIQKFDVQVQPNLSCTCQARTYFQLPCHHLLAFFWASNQMSDPTRFIGKRYLRGSWLTGLEQAGGSEPPGLHFSISEVCNIANSFLPPVRYGDPRGRPKSISSRNRHYRTTAASETWEEYLNNSGYVDLVDIRAVDEINEDSDQSSERLENEDSYQGSENEFDSHQNSENELVSDQSSEGESDLDRNPNDQEASDQNQDNQEALDQTPEHQEASHQSSEREEIERETTSQDTAESSSHQESDDLVLQELQSIHSRSKIRSNHSPIRTRSRSNPGIIRKRYKNAREIFYGQSRRGKKRRGN